MAIDQQMKDEMNEVFATVFGNEQLLKMARMQLATQLLAHSDVLSIAATAQDDKVDMALLVADKLMRRALA